MQQVLNQNRKVVAVGTSRGMIECQYFVNCGGFWARKIGKMSEPYVKVPLHACEHYYLHTKPIPGLDPMTPGKGVLPAYSDVSLRLFNCTIGTQTVYCRMTEKVVNTDFETVCALGVTAQFPQRANCHVTWCCTI